MEVEPDGDTAYEVGKWAAPSEDGKVNDAGDYIVIWKRTSGQWKRYPRYLDHEFTRAREVIPRQTLHAHDKATLRPCVVEWSLGMTPPTHVAIRWGTQCSESAPDVASLIPLRARAIVPVGD